MSHDNIMDEPQAWAELERFTSRVGVTLDERVKPEADTDGSVSYPHRPSDEELAGQSKLSNYDLLLAEIMSGRASISESGALTYSWRKPPGGSPSVLFDPGSWRYAVALRQAFRSPANKDEGTDTLGNFMRAAESLAKLPTGTISERLSNRDDTHFIIQLATTIFQE